MATITVRGWATAPARPDEATVDLAVEAVRATAGEAYDEASARASALARLLDDLAVPPDGRTTRAVTVREEREWVKNRYERRGYRATAAVAVRVADAALLARLVGEAARGDAQARIEGPWWTIAPDNPARLEAFRAASLIAKRKAEAVAGALGARLGAVVSVAEPGTRLGVEPLAVPAAPMLARAAPGAQEPAPIEEGTLTVDATVEVTFAVEEG